ncbi:hypothetical protein [Acinetobacter ursingii]|uniref:hypothetical protein n=1 Tax=Acinetobacter ursingii TaxID=108980 RepID=UPI001D193685|nr:hypothetical protein [Acinetobacter ursingii]
MKNLTEQQIDGNEEFLVGDAVVLIDEFESDDNRVFYVNFSKWDTNLSVLSSEKYRDIRGYCWDKKKFRHATIAEINAKRRLNSIEQAQGEVS